MKDSLLARIRGFGRFLEVWDWIWSIPLFIGLYWGFGRFFSYMEMSVGTFDLSFVQPLFLAVVVVIGASTASIYVLRFHFKTLYRYFYSKRRDTGLSSVEDLKTLLPWQRILLSLVVYGLYFLAVVQVFLTIL